MAYSTPPRAQAPTPLMDVRAPTTQGALPFLDLVCSITLVENSCLRAVQTTAAEELDAQFVEGRSSPMFHGNAMALLFEAAMDDEVERPYLMDLAEALYYNDDSEEEAEDQLDQGDFTQHTHHSTKPPTAGGGHHHTTEEELANDYRVYDENDGTGDPDESGEEYGHARGTSPMRNGGYSSADDTYNYRQPNESYEQYDANGEPVPQRVQTSTAGQRKLMGTSPHHTSTAVNDSNNMGQDPLMSYWRSHTASPGARQPTPATRPATRQDLDTRGTMRSFDGGDDISGHKRGGKRKNIKRTPTPSSFHQHKKLPHPLKSPPRSRTPGFNTSSRTPTRGGSTGRTNYSGEGDTTVVSTRTGKPLPPLAEESLRARGALESAKDENEFWANRLKMLQRELDKAQIRADAARNKDTKFEVSAVVNETVAAQLKEERRRDFALRSEKAQAIRAHKAAHRQAVRQAHSQSIQNKAESGRLLKVHQRNHQAIMDSIKKKEFDEKCSRRAEVQQVKVVSMLKRLREKAMRHEEIRRNYSLKVEHVKQEEKRYQEQSLVAVEESSKLVAKIRKLREVESSTKTSDFVLKGLDSQLYSEGA